MRKTMALLLLMLLSLTCIAALSESMFVGETVEFGTYEQDNKESKGAEPISWRILAIEEDCALLISSKALDIIPYSEADYFESSKQANLNWETSYLRSWMNQEFLKKAFSETERKYVINSQIETNDKTGRRTTEDYVFCLSSQEAKKLFVSDGDMACKPTTYAKKKNELIDTAIDKKGYCAWWLRDLSNSYHDAGVYSFMETTYNEVYFVLQQQGVYPVVSSESGMIPGRDNCVMVRPAIWVKTEGLRKDTSTDQTKQAITETETLNSVIHGMIESKQGVTEIAIAKKKTLTLDNSNLLEKITSKKLKWSTSDSAVATVTSGKIRAKACGQCNIICELKDGSGIVQTYHVTVFQPITSLKTDKNSITLAVGNSAITKVKTLPENAANKSIVWTSSDNEVATVDEQGKVTAKKNGKCVITCEAADGAGAKAKIEVYVPSVAAPSSFVVKGKAGATCDLSFKYYGKGTPKIKTSSDKYFDCSIVKVNGNEAKLRLTPKRVGTATITIKDPSDKKSTAQIKVTVDNSAVYKEVSKSSGVTLSGQNVKIKSAKFTAKFNHEFWYNRFRGRRVTVKASSGYTYLIIKLDLTNRTGRSLDAEDTLCVVCEIDGAQYYGYNFPNDYKSTTPSLYRYSGERIWNYDTKEMIYVTEVPISAKSADKITVLFQDDQYDFVGAYFYRE